MIILAQKTNKAIFEFDGAFVESDILKIISAENSPEAEKLVSKIVAKNYENGYLELGKDGYVRI